MSSLMTSETAFSIASTKIASVTFEGVRLFKDVLLEKYLSHINFWQQHKYLLPQDALTSDAISPFQERTTYNDMITANDPRQFHRVHNDKACSTFIKHFLIAPKNYYSAILFVVVSPAYAFAMRCIKDSDMEPHCDNYNNPISSTVCYHFTPEHLSNPIFVDRARFENPYPTASRSRTGKGYQLKM